MSMHDAVGEAIEIMKVYLNDGKTPSKDIEAILVRMQVHEFFHWFSPGGKNSRLWDELSALIADAHTTQEIKDGFIMLVQEVRGETYSWDGWRLVNADIRKELFSTGGWSPPEAVTGG